MGERHEDMKRCLVNVRNRICLDAAADNAAHGNNSLSSARSQHCLTFDLAQPLKPSLQVSFDGEVRSPSWYMVCVIGEHTVYIQPHRWQRAAWIPHLTPATQLCDLRPHHSDSLCLSFFICKMGMIAVPPL